MTYKPLMVSDISYTLLQKPSFFRRILPVFLIICGIALGLLFTTFDTVQANPFTRKNTNPVPQYQDDSLQSAPKRHTAPTPGTIAPKSNLMERIIFFQMKIKEK